MPSSIDQISTLQSGLIPSIDKNDAKDSDFSKIFRESLEEMNELQAKGDRAMADIATGQVKDLHQAAIAINKAEINMKMMLEIRNKALSAYKEISRTQI